MKKLQNKGEGRGSDLLERKRWRHLWTNLMLLAANNGGLQSQKIFDHKDCAFTACRCLTLRVPHACRWRWLFIFWKRSIVSSLKFNLTWVPEIHRASDSKIWLTKHTTAAAHILVFKEEVYFNVNCDKLRIGQPGFAQLPIFWETEEY